MSIHNDEILNKIEIGICERGNCDDPDPRKARRVGIRRPFKEGKNVQTEHLKFAPNVSPAGQNFKTPTVPLPGQLVKTITTSGGYSYVVGVINHVMESAAGTFNNMVPQINEAIEKTINVRIPPNVKTSQESNRSGLPKVIKEIEEKAQDMKTALLKGLPSYGSTPMLAGLINNPVRQVSTALTDFNNILNSGMLSSLTGQLFSMGNLLSFMTGEQIKELTDSMSAEANAAFSNMMTLMQSETGGSLAGNFMLGGMINPATFIPSLLSKLKGAKDFADIDDRMHSLMRDVLDDLGLEGLEDLIEDIEGIFGKFSRSISPSGEINITNSEAYETLLKLFNSLVSAIPAAQNKFFGSDSDIINMIYRLKDQSEITKAKENIENKSPTKNQSHNRLANGGSVTVGSQSWVA